LQRDQIDGDDIFGLVLDTFNDNESAVSFFTNPVGTRVDQTIANDAEWIGVRPFNLSWNTFWDAASSRTPEGWFAEMRIPFSSLRFQTVDDRVTIGVITWRRVARTSEIDAYPSIDPKWHSGHLKPSQAADVVIEGVSSRSPVHITPYLLAGDSFTVEVDDEPIGRSVGFDRTDEQISEVGLDLKYGITSNLNLDLTVNTDFAQVEADDAHVNLSRFSIFQPEKRPFFQERSAIFEFGTGGHSRLFYSRRIGLDEDDNPVRILAGARVVGRIGSWDVGALDMHTDATAEHPAENLGVFRVRRQVLNDGSSVGAMLTTRIAGDGAANLAYGLDSTTRFESGDELFVRWAQSVDRTAEGTTTSGLESGRFHAQLQRRTREGWGWTAIGGWSGEDYDPGLGFASRTDYTRLYNELRYSWLGDKDSWYRGRSWWVDGGGFQGNSSGILESGDFGLGTNVQTRASAWMWVDGRVFSEYLDEPFEIADDVDVPIGRHIWTGIAVGFNTPGGRALTAWGNVYTGGFYDGKRIRVTVEPTWTVSKHVALSCYYQVNDLRFDIRNQSDTIHLARLRARYALNTRLSIDLLGQYSSVDQELGANLRLRYNYREGTDLYLVLNERTSTDPLRDDLEIPHTSGRSIVLKYTHTLSL